MVTLLSVVAFVEFLVLLVALGKINTLRHPKVFDGTVAVDETEDKKTVVLDLMIDPNTIEFRKKILFKVVKPEAGEPRE